MRPKLKAAIWFVVLTGIVFSLTLRLNAFDRFRPIASDAEGYYQYLPAVFIKHDITAQPYSYYMEDGRLFNKYTCGVAMLEMPFFLGAHAITKITDPDAATGYTSNYVYGLQFAAAFYLVAGMFFLYFFLRRYFARGIIIFSLSLIYLGTNLFYYVHGECGMSHVYSFFIFAGFIYCTPYFLEFRSIRYTLIMAAFLGIAVLLRPTNMILTLFVLLYDVYTFEKFRERFTWLLKHWWHFIMIAAVSVIVYIPQMYYWHIMFGKLFVNSYRYDFAVTGFINWRHPKILQVLAGHRSGWLLYSPIMVLSVIGMLWTFFKRSLHSQATLFIFLVLLYLSASWSAYTFGSAYGYRPFIELSAVLSIPFTFVVAKILQSRSKLLIVIFSLFTANCIFLSIRLYYLYDSSWDGLWWKWENYFLLIQRAYYLNP